MLMVIHVCLMFSLVSCSAVVLIESLSNPKLHFLTVGRSQSLQRGKKARQFCVKNKTERDAGVISIQKVAR